MPEEMDVKAPIETERLILNLFDPSKSSDYDEIMTIFNDTFISGPFEEEAVRTREQVDDRARKQAVPRHLCKNAPPPSHAFLLAHLKSTGELIGMVSMTQRKDVPPDIGYAIFKQFNGRGFATEAARAALAFWTDVIGLEEIFLGTSNTNIASQRVAEKIGFVLGGSSVTVILPNGNRMQGRTYVLPGMAPLPEGTVIEARPK